MGSILTWCWQLTSFATTRDAELFQHGLDPSVAGKCLLLVRVVEGECLFEGEQVLSAVVLTASPLSRAQHPMDHVFLRGNLPPKSRRPLPSVTSIDLSRFYAHRRTLSEMVFFKGDVVTIEKSPERAAAGSNSPLAQLC